MTRKNILLITCDQYGFPNLAAGSGGFFDPLKAILGFAETLDADNPFARYFPGLLRLRNNAVVLTNHTIAASACTPSRAVIYTGQYGTRTGVTQTDGLFKNGDGPGFPWLAAGGIPTLGTWMREAGYSTHYFGKWHVSNPPDHSLRDYGFDDWESSYPEPHGAQANNLGLYRDVAFADAASSFLRRKAVAVDYDRALAEKARLDPTAPPPDPADARPWFAVASFTNPHDIATYPGLVSQAIPGDGQPTQKVIGPLTVPASTDRSLPPVAGTITLPLNPLGFPQLCGSVPATMEEDLSTKPSCQQDYAYKMGFALAAKLGVNAVGGASLGMAGKDAAAVALALQSTIPLNISPAPRENTLAFVQFYAWLHSVVDPHIHRLLQDLDDTGLAADTIVVFLTDHGEYAGAHGYLMEKWHTMYQEALHVPVVVQHPGDGPLTLKTGLTSHVDILPTILGLADVDDHARDRIYAKLRLERGDFPPLPGVDLAPYIRGHVPEVREPDGRPREGVLFITDDEITAPLHPITQDPHEQHALKEFAVYDQVVDAARHGTPARGPVPMPRGSVIQPNHVRCVRTARYKLARYIDPAGIATQEWEMYDLEADPNESTNLVQLTPTPPQGRTDLPGVDPAAVTALAGQLAELLQALEDRNLSTPNASR